MERALLIFKKLLTDYSIYEKDDYDLLMEYRDPEVREILETMSVGLNFTLLETAHALHMIPNLGNEIFNLSLREIREFISTAAKRKDAYLMLYITSMIIFQFYGGKNNDPKQREFVQITDIVKMLDKKFSISEERMEEEEGKYSLAFRQMAREWAARDAEDEGRRNTRIGKVLQACRFMQKYKLVYLIDEDREIRTTQRLDEIMRYHYLDQERVKEVNEHFEGVRKYA